MLVTDAATPTATKSQIEAMTSGECRWIGRPDVHLYCHNPMREVVGPGGRPAWLRTPGAARYCVVCPDAGLDYRDDYRTWVAADEAAALVDGIVGGLSRPGR